MHCMSALRVSELRLARSPAISYITRVKGDPRHRLGARAEQAAGAHYERRGFAVIERNVRMGRLEIDFIARRGDLIVIAEVRSRRLGGMVHPAATIRGTKAEHMRRAARMWLSARGAHRAAVRMDVIAATELPDGTFELDVYENVLSG